LEEDTKGEKKAKPATNTFVVGDGVPTQTQTKKKGLSSEQRRKIMEAIKKATSLGEIERLEKILSSGKIPTDFDLDSSQPKEAKSVPESENNTDSQTASKKGEDLEAKQENKGTETKVEKKNKDSAEKEKSDKSKGEESNQTEGEGETEGLADQEPDEGDASSRWEKADAQVDIDMTE